MPQYRSKVEKFVDYSVTAISDADEATKHLEKEPPEWEKAEQRIESAKQFSERLAEEFPELKEAALRCAELAEGARKAVQEKRVVDAHKDAEAAKRCNLEMLADYVKAP